MEFKKETFENFIDASFKSRNFLTGEFTDSGIFRILLFNRNESNIILINLKLLLKITN